MAFNVCHVVSPMTTTFSGNALTIDQFDSAGVASIVNTSWMPGIASAAFASRDFSRIPNAGACSIIAMRIPSRLKSSPYSFSPSK